jgi:hypothetical protein
MEVSFQLQFPVSFIPLPSPLSRGRSPCFRPQTYYGHCNEELIETPIFRSVNRYLQSRQGFVILTSAQRRPLRKSIHLQSRVGQTLCHSCAFFFYLRFPFYRAPVYAVTASACYIDRINDWGWNEDFTTFFRPPCGLQRHAQAQSGSWDPGGAVEIGHIYSSII